MDKDIFMQFCVTFVTHLPGDQIYPVFLWLDHHFSRDRAEALEYLKGERVIAMFGPSHMTIL